MREYEIWIHEDGSIPFALHKGWLLTQSQVAGWRNMGRVQTTWDGMVAMAREYVIGGASVVRVFVPGKQLANRLIYVLMSDGTEHELCRFGSATPKRPQQLKVRVAGE